MAGISLRARGQSGFDVLGAGVVAVDHILVVDKYPAADRKVEVLESRRECGGLAGTALIAAARLGARCAYAGTLGTDELSTFVLECLGREGIDLTHVTRRPGAGPVHSIVVVERDGGARNIFFDVRSFVGPNQLSPPGSLIPRTRVLLVDHCGIDGAIRLGRIARAAGVHIIADFDGATDDPRLEELLGLIDHVVLSLDFARELVGKTDPVDVANALWSDSREAVVITVGAEGAWSRDQSGEVHHCPAFPVTVRDTTGCGDVFHGAYAAGLVQGLDLHQRVRLASAAAALAAGAIGQEGVPTTDKVSALLAKSPDPIASTVSRPDGFNRECPARLEDRPT